MPINWNISKPEMEIAEKIATRAVRLYRRFGSAVPKVEILMDVVACHMNGTRLRLKDLLEADDLNFAHDIFGIRDHINRTSGQIEDSFLPRFSFCDPKRGKKSRSAA